MIICPVADDKELLVCLALGLAVPSAWLLELHSELVWDRDRSIARRSLAFLATLRYIKHNYLFLAPNTLTCIISIQRLTNFGKVFVNTMLSLSINL